MDHTNDAIRILIGTWNINKDYEAASKELPNWFKHMAFEMHRVSVASSQVIDSSNSAASLTEYDVLNSSPSKGLFQQEIPEVIVLGFQEWRPLLCWDDPNLKKFLIQLQAALSMSFPPASPYTIAGYAQWMGFLLIVLHQASLQSVSLSRFSSIGTGPLWIGSKGAIGAKLELSIGTRGTKYEINLINAHLAANPSNIKARRTEYELIFHRLFAEKIAAPLQAGPSFSWAVADPRVNSCEVSFFFGDLNYRISEYIDFDENSSSDEVGETRIDISPIVQMSPSLGPLNYQIPIPPFSLNYQGRDHYCTSPTMEKHGLPLHTSFSLQTDRGSANECQKGAYFSRWLKEKNWTSLLAFDQLTHDRAMQYSFAEFDEPMIFFPPTFKYHPGSSHLDVVDKSRHIPSWCDRILYYFDPTKVYLETETYTSTPFVFSSDHKPVFALFTIHPVDPTRHGEKILPNVPIKSADADADAAATPDATKFPRRTIETASTTRFSINPDQSTFVLLRFRIMIGGILSLFFNLTAKKICFLLLFLIFLILIFEMVSPMICGLFLCCRRLGSHRQP